ncbi:hypothetical protein T552_03307 [Pneumocystis carinii B80]|uniref:Centromere protein H C-terminal domain-containing protein n=1 Tax=Pneumocystis carinii (strain B80) TaxID=1408658 RepID=A0A0W4ZB96_PNEC8|nr:hypothetical protein T552_03307 [Pneumocystis carinii B80]KTW25695.1 hypothetical protein T552_03307 [Pneumocystis carinii B80]
MNSLKELSGFCELLILSITEDRNQFHRLKLCFSEVFNEKERNVLSLFKKLEELKNERKMLLFEDEIVVDNSILDQELSEKIKEAEFELLVANATNTTKDLIIESFVETNPILQAVYSTQDSTKQNKIIGLCLENCDNIISNLLNLHNILIRNEKKIAPLQKEVLKSFLKNKEKVDKIMGIITNIKDREEKILSVLEKQQKDKLIKEMNDIKNRATIVKNCLQGIILESGIDWYENEYWRNIMLKAGELDNY